MPTYFADEDGTCTPEQGRSRAQLVVLSDELTPEALTDRLGIAPDASWLQGETRRGGRPHPHHGWTIESRIPEARPVEEHIADLLERLRPIALRISDLPRDPAILSARLWISRHGQNWNPGLSLDADLIRSLEALGLGIDIDIYVFGEPEPMPNERPMARPARPH